MYIIFETSKYIYRDDYLRDCWLLLRLKSGLEKDPISDGPK